MSGSWGHTCRKHDTLLFRADKSYSTKDILNRSPVSFLFFVDSMKYFVNMKKNQKPFLGCKYRYWNRSENSVKKSVETESSWPQVVRNDSLGDQRPGNRLKKCQKAAKYKTGNDEIDSPVTSVFGTRSKLYIREFHIFSGVMHLKSIRAIKGRFQFFEVIEVYLFCEIFLMLRRVLRVQSGSLSSLLDFFLTTLRRTWSE